MVEKPPVSAFQNFLWIENQLNIKKVMGRNVWMCFVLAGLTYIALNALHALIFVSTVSTNNIAYTIYNSIALMLCIDNLDNPLMYTQQIR